MRIEVGSVNRGRKPSKGFTLIEVLVVVAIVALLISILMPSLRAAKEAGRRASCLSNLHQNGLGFSAYSVDFNGLLPLRGHYGYDIKESNPDPNDPARPTIRVNYGALFGRYIGRSTEPFMCPGYIAAIRENPNWQRLGIHSFLDPAVTQTFGGYMYAAPVAGVDYDKTTRKLLSYHPSLKQRDPYWPTGVPKDGGIWHDNYRLWLTSQKGYNLTPSSPNYYQKYKPPIIQAIQVDQIIGLDDGRAIKNLHRDGLNALFGDMHAKFVKDDEKRTLTRTSPTSGPNGAAQLYTMWEYFGRRH